MRRAVRSDATVSHGQPMRPIIRHLDRAVSAMRAWRRRGPTRKTQDHPLPGPERKYDPDNRPAEPDSADDDHLEGTFRLPKEKRPEETEDQNG